MSHNFGASLREARERKGISLRQISMATKISVAALESLERNDFSRLPGGIFSRAFVRSYAIEVGLDPDRTVHEFLAQFGEESNSPASPSPGQAAAVSHSSRHVTQGTVRRAPSPEGTDEFDFESKQQMASVVLKLVLVSLPLAAIIMYVGSRAVAPASSPEAIPPAPGPVATQTLSADAPAVSTAPPAPEPGLVTAAAEPEAAPAGFTIEITPSADCWAQLTADGEVVLSRVVRAGEHATQRIRDAAVLHVGDAAACAFSINGRPARPLGAPKQVRQVRITRDTYAALLQ